MMRRRMMLPRNAGAGLEFRGRAEGRAALWMERRPCKDVAPTHPSDFIFSSFYHFIFLSFYPFIFGWREGLARTSPQPTPHILSFHLFILLSFYLWMEKRPYKDVILSLKIWANESITELISFDGAFLSLTMYDQCHLEESQRPGLLTSLLKSSSFNYSWL